MKLSANTIRRFTAVAMNCGESFGLLGDVILPSTAHHYWTSYLSFDDEIVPYSLLIDDFCFYVCLNSGVYTCKRSIHYSLGIEEMVLFLYLVFCKHRTFEL